MGLTPDELPLYAEILANPDDVTPRLVLADALLARGEPYGEYLARANGRPTRGTIALRDRVAAAFLGPVDAALQRGGRTWTGGLLTTATLARPDAVAEPLWGTVRELAFGAGVASRYPTLTDWLDAAPLAWLDRLRIGGTDGLAVALRTTRPYRALHVEHLGPLEAPPLAKRLPLAVRELTFGYLPMLRPDSTPLVAPLFALPLDRLAFGLGETSFAQLAELARTGASREVVFTTSPEAAAHLTAQLTFTPATGAWAHTGDARRWLRRLGA